MNASRSSVAAKFTAIGSGGRVRIAAVEGVLSAFWEIFPGGAAPGAGATTVAGVDADATSAGGEASRLAYNTSAAISATRPAKMRRRARVIARSVAQRCAIAYSTGPDEQGP